MGLRKLWVIIVCGIWLVGCDIGSGANNTRPNQNNTSLYGQLQGTPESGPQLAITDLQAWIAGNEGGVCNGTESSGVGSLNCIKDQKYINSQPTVFGLSGGVKVTNFVANNPLHILNVDTYKLIYNTPGVPYFTAGNAILNETVSGSLLVPDNIAESEIKGVVLFFHPTVFSKSQVPSNFSESMGIAQDKTLAAVYASQGYMVVIPDYIGLGVDTAVVHPYVAFPQTNAQSGIYMLKATHQFLQQHGITRNFPLYITSYSEGGAYAAWASKLAQGTLASVLSDSNITLTRTVGVSGAYDLSGVMLPFAFTNINNSWDSTANPYNVSPGYFESSPFFALQSSDAALVMEAAKVPLAGYLMAAFAYYNGTPNTLAQFVAPSFVSMQSCLLLGDYFRGESTPSTCLINGQNYTLPELFSSDNPSLNNGNISDQLVGSAIGATNYITGGEPSVDVLVAKMLKGYRNNSIASFVSPTIQTSSLIIPFVIQQNIYNWTTNSPLSLIYLRYDSVVPNVNSKEACGQVSGVPSVFANSASGMVTCQEVDNTNLVTGGLVPIFMDHTHAEAVLQIAALHQISAN